MTLLVRHFDRLVGRLESTPDRGVVFRYAPDYLATPGARGISRSLPLGAKEYSQAACMPFFSGLLPDGELRRRVADYLHVSETSTLRLLEALGGECAGTISLSPEDPDAPGSGAPGLDCAPSYELLPEEALAALIGDSERRPLLAPIGTARLSLAGAQDKIPLLLKDGQWFRPLGGAASSHIIKPASAFFPDLVANEFFCLKLAGALGLRVPKAELRILGRSCLVVERYDRASGSDGRIERIHQEDACQALGIMPERKYQADGGPGFPELSRLLRDSCSRPLADIEALVRIALFNFLIGNCDAHGKNFSLLYRGGAVELAPFYDLVSTTAYPELTTKLSMKLGKEHRIDHVRQSDLEAFAMDLGVKPRLVLGVRDELLGLAPKVWEEAANAPGLEGHSGRIEAIRAGWDRRAAATGPS